MQLQVLKYSSLQCDQACGSSELFKESYVVLQLTLLNIILYPLIDKLLQQMWTAFLPNPLHEQTNAYSTIKILHIYNALWVKSGNRGNLKCLNVNNHFALIFHRKFFISFLSDAKLPKVYDRFLCLIRKKVENCNFNRAPLHNANIDQIFLKAISSENICSQF